MKSLILFALLLASAGQGNAQINSPQQLQKRLPGSPLSHLPNNIEYSPILANGPTSHPIIKE